MPTDRAGTDMFNRRIFFFQDAVKSSEAKTADKLDVYGHDGALLFECREPNLGALTKAARFIGGNYDAMASFNLIAKAPRDGTRLFRIARTTRTFSLGSHVISFFDENDALAGEMRKKWLTLNSKYDITKTRSGGDFII